MFLLWNAMLLFAHQDLAAYFVAVEAEASAAISFCWDNWSCYGILQIGSLISTEVSATLGLMVIGE
jgi:hypothetical protein